MSRIEISGVGVAYELYGEPGAPAIAITPGSREPKETPGLKELTERLVAGGRRVLLWDRPNCGSSDICFDADNESALHARTLTGLIRALDLGRTTIAGGSAGSRVSLMAAAHDPEITSHLAVWWITGGNLGLMNLAIVYCGASANMASWKGMEGVADLPCWAEQIRRNPRNREIILAQDRDRFIETMQRWASFYIPSPDSPVPGMSPADFARLTMPVRIHRNGWSDVSHTRRTTDWAHELTPGSELIDAPWPDTEWNERVQAAIADGSGMFVGWPALAPSLLEFSGR